MADRQETSKTVTLEITPGEAYDRLAILLLKSERVKDPVKRELVHKEIRHQRIADKLLHIVSGSPYSTEGVIDLSKELTKIHGELWDVENRLRRCEAQEDFGDFFVADARRVYKLNDRRSEIKGLIDKAYGHAPEVKEYDYGQKKETAGPRSTGCPHAGG